METIQQSNRRKDKKIKNSRKNGRGRKQEGNLEN
jgi:hypothetical protein